MSSLDILESTILANLKKISGIKSCEALPEKLEAKKIPGLFVDIVNVDPLGSDGTGRLIVQARFEVRCIVPKSKVSERAARNLALEVMGHVNAQSKWGLSNVGSAVIRNASPSPFKIWGDSSDDSLPSYDVWMIEFDQEVALGDNIWESGDIVPKTALVGMLPEIGTDYEDGYEIVSEGSDVQQ